jgi:O-antigen/teichoic acid export membrane protein
VIAESIPSEVELQGIPSSGLNPSVARLAPGASVLRGAMALFSTQPLTWAATIFLVTFLPRLLGDRALGEYTIVMTVTTVAGTIAALGVPDYLVRKVAIQPDRAMLEAGVAFVLMLGASVIGAAALLGVLTLVHPVVSDPALLLVALCALVVQAAQNPIMALLRGQERHAPFAWLNAAATILAVVGGLGALLLGGSAAAYMAAGVVTAAIVTALGMRASGFRLDVSAFRPALLLEIARNGLTFLGMSLSLRIRGEIDKLLLAALASASAVGWYAAALRVVSIPIFIPTLLATPLLPALSRAAGDRPVFLRTLRRSLEVVLMLTAPLGAGLIALAPAVPDLLGWGATFHNSVPLLSVLACQMVLVAINTILGTALIAMHRERIWFRVIVVAALFNTALNLLLIPFWEHAVQNGAIGAAITTAVTELVMTLGALVALPRHTIDRATAIRVVQILVANLAVGAVARALLSSSILLSIGAGGVTWALAMWLLGLLRPSDLQSIRTIVLTSVARRSATST